MVTNLAAAQARQLHTQVSGEVGAPDVVLLHGLFGMGSNLGVVARALCDAYRVHQVDLPSHGRSPWADSITIDGLAAAVGDYLRGLGSAPVAVVGHSLGGKVAMQLALQAPEAVSAIVLADIAPVVYPGSHGPVFAALRAVERSAPASRGAAREIMAAYVDEPEVVQFLLLSLAKGEDGDYHWRFNVDALERDYDNLLLAPEGPAPNAVPALFVYGGASPYVQEEGIAAARALFSDASFKVMEGAGHWLHAEQPTAFNAAVRDFLDRTVPSS